LYFYVNDASVGRGSVAELIRRKECKMSDPAAVPAVAPAVPPTAANDIAALKAKAPEVAEFLRLLANPNRLLLLCHLSQRERSVTEIQRDLGLRQPALSQQLAELRQSGLVQTRRESRSIYYTIKDSRARAVVGMLHAIFCSDGTNPPAPVPNDQPGPVDVAPPRDAATFARLDNATPDANRQPRSTS
jgi:DNA-binding transcriptional ArsR family regulator